KTIQEPIYESYYVENKVKGTETYIWAADRGVAKSEAVTYEGENVGDSLNALDLNSPEARIRGQLYTKFYFRNSLNLATYIEESFGAAGRVSHGGVKQRNDAGIWVLQATGMPSVLVEMGFITNKEEEQYMMSTDGQNEIAENITQAFRRYKDEIESGPKPSSQVFNTQQVDASIKK
ncbi:MAG: N-acetylmuramoyl-L-alanine amidase, partial [Chitinophagaceae bacterium]